MAAGCASRARLGGLNRPGDWPAWWRAVKRVERVAEGDLEGLGAVRRFTWATALPYTITFEMETTRIEPMHILEGRARGELDGIGRWTLVPNGAGTYVRYDRQVELTKPGSAPLRRSSGPTSPGTTRW